MLTRLKAITGEHKAVFWILGLGLLFRIVYLYLYSGLPDWSQLTVDNNFHHHWALSILSGNIVGDTTYFRAPFYIYYLALIYKLFGVSLWAVRICGICLGLISVLLTYLITYRLFERKPVALLAGFIHAIYPIAVYFESELLLDSLFTILLQAHLFCLLSWWGTRSYRTLFFAGLWFGAACITRPTPLMFIPLILITLYLFTRNFSLFWRQAVLFCIGALLLILPITIRNILVADDPVLIASQGGINLYIGNNDNADGISAVMPEPVGFNWRIQQITYMAEQDTGKELKPGEVSSYWTGKAFDWIVDNPGRFIGLYFEKLYHNISDREISNNRYLDIFFPKIPLLDYSFLSFGILFSISCLTILLTIGSNRKVLYVTLLLLLYILVSALFFFSSRFRLPLLPLYFALTAYGLTHIVLQIRQKSTGALFSLGLVILVGFISFYPIVSLPKGSPSHHLISKGLFYSAQQEYTTALQYFQRAKRIDPEFAETDLNIGATYIHLGQTDSARYYLQIEKQKHPRREKAYINLASLYHLEGKLDSAQAEISAALTLQPYNLTANMLEIRILYADSSIGPRQLYQTVLRNADRTSGNIYLLYDAALLYSNRQEYQLAEQLLQLAATSSPPPIETDDEAFQHVSQNQPKLWEKEKSKVYYQWGYICGLTNRFEQAIKYSNKAIALDSSNTPAYVNLISGNLSIGEITKARALLQQALDKFPSDSNLTLIQSYLKQ